jgi:hypothetical protein
MLRYILIGLVIIFLALMAFFAQPAGAQSQVVPTPPPPVVPTNPIDQANAEAAQWDAVQQAAIGAAQSAASQAVAAASQAQAAAAQAQVAAQQEHAARVAAEQGLLNQSVESSHQAQLAAVQAVSLGKDATQSASMARQQADLALRNVANLKISLMDVTAQRDTARSDAARWQTEATKLDKDRTALAGALKAEQDRSDLLSKVAIGSLMLLGVTLTYIAFVLAKLMRALRIKPNDRIVVLNERGMVKAQIEALR